MKLQILLPVVALLTCSCIIHVRGDGGLAFHNGFDSSGPRRVGNNVPAQQTFDVAPFDALKIEDSIEVTARIGTERSVLLSGDENLLQYVVIEVDENTLEISMKKGSYNRHQPMRVEVTAPALRAASIAGSSDLSIEGLDQEEFRISIAGSGDIQAAGRVGRLEASIAGSGDMKLYDLQARDAVLDIAGSGDIQTSVTGSIDASIHGSGDIRYKGQPHCQVSISGSGSVRRSSR